MILKILLLFLLLSSFAFASNMSIERIGKYDPLTRSFTVLKSFEVIPGDTLLIPSGVSVYFSPLTGLDVKGCLIIAGTSDSPVLLSSKKSQAGQGSPYDWRGIQLYPSASCKVSYSYISYASYGIVSCCENVDLVNTSFESNATNLKIGDRVIPVTDKSPFNFNSSSDRIKSPSINLTSGLKSQDYSKLIRKSYIPKRTFVISPIALGLCVAGGIFIVRWNRSMSEYDSYKLGNKSYDNSSFSNREEEFRTLKSNIIYNGILGYGMASLGLVSGTYITIYTLNF